MKLVHAPESSVKYNNEQGIVMVVAMMILFVLSMIGAVVVNMSVQGVRIARNYQDSQEWTMWTEAGIEAARQEIVNSHSPEMSGFSCEDTAAEADQLWYPEKALAIRKVRYCVELVDLEQEGDTSNRLSGQEAGKKIMTYFYRLDAMVLKGNTVVRRALVLEQHSRYTI